VKDKEKAQCRRQEDDNYGDSFDLNGREIANYQGPNQIKQFFDPKRPGNAEGARRFLRNSDETVLQKEGISPPRRGSFKNGVSVRGVQAGNNQEHKNKQAIVKRPNPKATARVEILKISFELFGIQQDSSDQKAGEYKKEIDAHPSVGGDWAQVQRGKGIAIVDQYEKYCYAPDSVELRDLVDHGVARRLSSRCATHGLSLLVTFETVAWANLHRMTVILPPSFFRHSDGSTILSARRIQESILSDKPDMAKQFYIDRAINEAAFVRLRKRMAN